MLLFVIIIASTILNTAMSFDKSSSAESNPFHTLPLGCSDFASNLYKTLSPNFDENIIISPFSLHMILSLLSNGAGGLTLDELKIALAYIDGESLMDEFKALIVLLNDAKNITLHIENAIYIQKGIDVEGDFLSTCMNTFQSSISKINFKNNNHAAQIINSWVQTATHNKISDILSPDDIDVDTKVVLLNAIYFKSKWLKPFKEKDTQQREFHVSKTKTYLVPTMYRKASYFYGEVPNWNTQFIEIPYLNEDFVMIILLPERHIELQNLEKNFNWQELINTYKISDDIELYLPKFKFEIGIDLKNTLSEIGLNMFNDNCDLSRLSKIPLKVGNVLQKIFIEVNEQGAEAAAATAVETRMRRMAITPMEFIVDRPFMFAIQYTPTKIPLFIGSVRKLSSSSMKDEL